MLCHTIGHTVLFAVHSVKSKHRNNERINKVKLQASNYINTSNFPLKLVFYTTSIFFFCQLPINDQLYDYLTNNLTFQYLSICILPQIKRGRETEVQRPPDGMIHQRIDTAVEEGSIIKWAHAMRKQSPGIAKQRSERTNKAFRACSASDLWRARRRKQETCNSIRVMLSEPKNVLLCRNDERWNQRKGVSKKSWALIRSIVSPNRKT